MNNHALLPVGSPQFLAWFNGSAVTGPGQEPLLVYHGDQNPNRTFNRCDSRAGTGTMFIKNKKVAESYATSGRLYEAYLAITNPCRIKLSQWNAEATSGKGKAWTDTLIQQGHDGLIVDNSGDFYYVPFLDSQVLLI